MKATLLAALLAIGCGSGVDESAFTGCSANGFEVEAQGGVAACHAAMAQVSAELTIYARRWGWPDLTGWRIRFVSGEAAPGHNSTTDWGNRLVIVGKGGAEWLPHELHHVQLGPSSINHAGWCLDFQPWELATLGLNEASYLGCDS